MKLTIQINPKSSAKQGTGSCLRSLFRAYDRTLQKCASNPFHYVLVPPNLFPFKVIPILSYCTLNVCVRKKFEVRHAMNQSRVRVEKQIRSTVATSKLRRKSEVGNVRHLFHLLSNFTSTTKSFLHSTIMSSSPLPVADSSQGKQQSNKRARLHLHTNPLIFQLTMAENSFPKLSTVSF